MLQINFLLYKVKTLIYALGTQKEVSHSLIDTYGPKIQV